MTIKFKLKKGEIWIVQLTVNKSDIVGHEQGKTRPCIIIVINNFVDMATIIPLTSNISTTKFPHTHLIKKSSKNKLSDDSVALVFQLRSLSQLRFLKKIGEIDYSDLIRIKILISNYLKL